MWTRRQFLSRGGLGLLALAGSGRWLEGQQQEKMPDGSAAKEMITSAAQQAIDNGLAYLARNQDPKDGSFGTGHYKGNVAITSLAALAMMAGGHLPGRGAYGKVVRSALEYVLNQDEKKHKLGGKPGFLHNSEGTPHAHGPMYGHGFGTLFLAEVYGMVHDRKLREELHDTLERAVKVIIDSQNGEGGWRYLPKPEGADISVTICQIMALRAARNAGFSVPKSVADKCIEYVKRCQEFDGGFRYMAQGGGTAFARTAAGVVALYSAGVYQGPAIEKGLNYLTKRKPGQNSPRHDPRDDMHYFYGHYYAVQAMWIAGGNYWVEWYPAIRDELLLREDSPRRANRLRDDGSWDDQICRHYGTAMACFILQVPNNCLPILQK